MSTPEYDALFVEVPQPRGALVRGINAEQGSFEVRIRFRIDEEIMWLVEHRPWPPGSNRDGTYIVKRGREGTTKAAHSAGATIEWLPVRVY